jgi:hypothetical protein
VRLSAQIYNTAADYQVLQDALCSLVCKGAAGDDVQH